MTNGDIGASHPISGPSHGQLSESVSQMLGTSDHQDLQQAMVLQQKGQFNEAAKLYRELIRRNPSNFHALHFLGIIEAAVGNIEQAKFLMARSLAIEPPNIQFVENYATTLFQAGDYETAIQVCQQGFQLNKSNISLLYINANALFQLNKFQESITQFDRLLSLRPQHLEALNERGSALAEMGQYEAALVSVEKALALNKRYAEAHLNKGNIYGKLKRHDEAISAFDAALSLKPSLPDAWVGRGNVCREIKRYDEALAAYDNALSLKPVRSNAWLGCGNVFYELRRLDEALDAYKKALSLEPDLSEAWLGQGNVFFELRRFDEALNAYDKALSLKPDLASAWLGRGNLWHKRGRPEDAASDYAKMLAIDPEFPFGKGLLLHQKMLCCDWNGIGDLTAEIKRDVASGKRSAEPFGYQAISHSAHDLKRCAEIYAADKYPASRTPLWRGERYNNEKIRLGYVSGEFRNQAVAILMVELYELHNKDRFELFAFDNGWDDGSEIRKRINTAFNTIVDISRLDDLQAATIIRQKQIDILINLNGYFGGHRNRVFSYKPAPIQVSYLGFPATMGADYIDYIIADPCVIPPGQEDHYVEKIVRLPENYLAIDTKRLIANRQPTRTEAMLPETSFVFCCFNNSYKITPEIFEIWMRLLRKVDGSTLWLLESNAAAPRYLRQEASRLGIAPERLVFAPRADLPDHLARHRLADLFVDTLPYNAHTTAVDALWAGLPVLTCLGSTFPGRVAASLLRAIGLPELIVRSLEDYEAMAVRLAQEPKLLASLKAKLAQNRATYPLFDSKRFVRHMEAAYSTLWERQRRGEPPVGFAVAPNSAQ